MVFRFSQLWWSHWKDIGKKSRIQQKNRPNYYPTAGAEAVFTLRRSPPPSPELYITEQCSTHQRLDWGQHLSGVTWRNPEDSCGERWGTADRDKMKLLRSFQQDEAHAARQQQTSASESAIYVLGKQYSFQEDFKMMFNFPKFQMSKESIDRKEEIQLNPEYNLNLMQSDCSTWRKPKFEQRFSHTTSATCSCMEMAKILKRSKLQQHLWNKINLFLRKQMLLQFWPFEKPQRDRPAAPCQATTYRTIPGSDYMRSAW